MSGAGKVLAAYVHPAAQIEHSFHLCLMNLVNHDAAHEQRLFGSPGPLMMRAGTGGLVEARNKTMQHFLDQASEEWLWMVDTDMGFAADTVDRLVAAADPVDRPVVGALCFGLKLGGPDGYGGYLNHPFPTIYLFAQDQTGMSGFHAVTDYPRDEVIPVAGTGAACLLVHRSAAEKVRAEHGDHWFDPIRYEDGRPVSEDLSFCYRLGAVGIPIHVDTRVKTTHAKQIWVGEREYTAHRALAEAMTAAMRKAVPEGVAVFDPEETTDAD